MILPSKELLSIILKKYIVEFIPYIDGEFDPCLQIDTFDGVLLLNIYELMHMMKEWAFEEGYIISSFKSLSVGGYIAIINGDNKFATKTEFEAMTKAAEWVRKQIDIKL
jgi:hypothetical protein